MKDPYYNPTLPDHVPQELVYDFNIYAPEIEGVDLFESVHRLHSSGAPDIFWSRNNGGHWVVLSSDLIAEVASDPEHFSSKRMFIPDEQNFETEFFVPLQADPPEHAGYRSIIAPIFAPARIKEIEARVREFTGALINDLKPRGECEFTTDFAMQMPVIVFLQLLDLPPEDRPRLLSIADRIVRQPPEGERRDDAMQDMFDYIRPILEERFENPRDDVLSKLVKGLHNGKEMTPDQRLGLASTVLTGGLDSVAGTLCHFARFLAENPSARKRLIDDPTLSKRAIDEMLRRFSPTTHGRSLAKDYSFHNVAMNAGDHIVWMASMYDLDDKQFPDPMSVDFDRKRCGHIGFGVGPHFCMGAFLARMELKVFVEEWLKRIPDFQIKPGVDVRYRPGINIGLQNLPLEW